MYELRLLALSKMFRDPSQTCTYCEMCVTTIILSLTIQLLPVRQCHALPGYSTRHLPQSLSPNQPHQKHHNHRRNNKLPHSLPWIASQNISQHQSKHCRTIATSCTADKTSIFRITAPLRPTTVIPRPGKTYAFADTSWYASDYEAAVVADGVKGVDSILEVGRCWEGGGWQIFWCRLRGDYLVECGWYWLISVWRWRWCLLHRRLSNLVDR